MQDFSAEECLFYDETKLDPREVRRRYARSLAGTQAIAHDLGIGGKLEI